MIWAKGLSILRVRNSNEKAMVSWIVGFGVALRSLMRLGAAEVTMDSGACFERWAKVIMALSCEVLGLRRH